MVPGKRAVFVKMHDWLQDMFPLCSIEECISGHQLRRTQRVTLKTAWLMAHRTWEAMRDGDLAPFEVGSGAVEVYETFKGREPGEFPLHRCRA